MTRVYLPKELSTEAGAKKNAAMLHDYWWRHGHHAVVVEPVRTGTDDRRQPCWGVQSNLVNGKP